MRIQLVSLSLNDNYLCTKPRKGLYYMVLMKYLLHTLHYGVMDFLVINIIMSDYFDIIIFKTISHRMGYCQILEAEWSLYIHTGGFHTIFQICGLYQV